MMVLGKIISSEGYTFGQKWIISIIFRSFCLIFFALLPTLRKRNDILQVLKFDSKKFFYHVTYMKLAPSKQV